MVAITRKLLRIALSAMTALVFVGAPAFADSFTVLVGYADNLRASGFFPSPWIGATFNGQTVVSQTNPAGILFDSGAVRIDNTGSNSIAISDFQVSENNGGTVFNIWGSGLNLTLAAGQSGIFTQFPNSTDNFDTSDQGLFGALPPANLEPNNADHNGNTNLIGGCSSPASFYTPAQASGVCNPLNAPVISFKENGTPVSFVDSGFILDTGEWDFVNNSSFGEDGNESIDWNSLGGTSRGGTGTPEPSTILLFGSGLIVFGAVRRREHKRRAHRE